MTKQNFTSMRKPTELNKTPPSADVSTALRADANLQFVGGMNGCGLSGAELDQRSFTLRVMLPAASLPAPNRAR